MVASDSGLRWVGKQQNKTGFRTLSFDRQSNQNPCEFQLVTTLGAPTRRNPFFIRSSLFLMGICNHKGPMSQSLFHKVIFVSAATGGKWWRRKSSQSLFHKVIFVSSILSLVVATHKCRRNPFFIRSSLFLFSTYVGILLLKSQSLFHKVIFVSMPSMVWYAGYSLSQSLFHKVIFVSYLVVASHCRGVQVAIPFS